VRIAIVDPTTTDASTAVLADEASRVAAPATAVEALRVRSIGEASLHLAALVAHRFSIATLPDCFRPAVRDMVRRCGPESRGASVRATDPGVLEAERDLEATVEKPVREARVAVEGDGAEAVCLAAAVELVEGLAACGLRTSGAVACREPEPKALVLPAGVLPGLAAAERA
jgi:allantoin racemase